MPSRESIHAELAHICADWPVEPGDTLSHQTANECGRRGWADRHNGAWYPTMAGHRENTRWRLRDA